MIFSCKPIEEVSVTGIDGFGLKKISSDGIEGEINLKIKNPNTMGFSIYPSEFDILYSGINLGKAKLHKRVHISSNVEKSYAFQLKSNLEGINMMDISKLILGNKVGKIEVKGNLKVGKFLIRKKYPINYSDKVSLFNK